MNNSIQVFSNQDFSVRTVREADGTVWFVAKDVMTALEYAESSTPAQVMQSVPDIWKGIKRIDSRSENGVEQARDVLCLTEQGVYFFLGRSDKPKALSYQMWVAGEIMPSLRETGSYSAGRGASSQMSPSLEDAKCIYSMYGLEGNQLILALDKVYTKRNGFSALEAAGIQLVAPQQTQLLNPTDIGQHFGLNARQINNILVAEDYQRRLPNGKYEPTDKGKAYSVMLDTWKRHSDGTPIRQLKWDSSILEALGVVLEAQHDCTSANIFRAVVRS
jgi:prophage antirepressor-like protein